MHQNAPGGPVYEHNDYFYFTDNYKVDDNKYDEDTDDNNDINNDRDAENDSNNDVNTSCHL